MAPFATGGDMCILLVQTSRAALANASGVPIERMALAIGIPPDDSGFAAGVMAIRFRGVDDRSLVDVRLKAGSHSTPTIRLPAKVVKVRVGGAGRGMGHVAAVLRGSPG